MGQVPVSPERTRPMPIMAGKMSGYHTCRYQYAASDSRIMVPTVRCVFRSGDMAFVWLWLIDRQCSQCFFDVLATLWLR